MLKPAFIVISFDRGDNTAIEEQFICYNIEEVKSYSIGAILQGYVVEIYSIGDLVNYDLEIIIPD